MSEYHDSDPHNTEHTLEQYKRYILRLKEKTINASASAGLITGSD